MTVPDPISAIIALLAADSAVTAIAGSRVYGGSLPPYQKQSMPEGAVIVSPTGGPGRRGYNLYRQNRVDTTCYGATLLESWQLHLAVREVLENLRRNGALFWAQTISDGANALDPVEQWPTCYASYLVMSATHD